MYLWIKEFKIKSVKLEVLYHKTEHRDDKDIRLLLQQTTPLPVSLRKILGGLRNNVLLTEQSLNSIQTIFLNLVYKSLQGIQNRYVTFSLPQFVLQVWSNGTNFYSLSGKL